MGFIYDTMAAFLREHEFTITEIGDSPSFSMTVVGNNGQWACIAYADDEQRMFVFYSASPVEAPEQQRAAIAEFVTRANYNMLVGNFELNVETGDIRYKTSVSLKGIPDEALQSQDVLQKLLEQLIYVNIFVMDQYLPGIHAVVDGTASPKEAIARIESA